MNDPIRKQRTLVSCVANDTHHPEQLDIAKRHNHLRILFADDDPTLQRSVKRVAESRGDALIQETAGAGIFERALESQPDVIVLDVAFPDFDGRDALAKLKRDQRTANIPVVVWSGERRDPESDSRIALALGAEDYVEKSNAELLFCKLDRVLLRRR